MCVCVCRYRGPSGWLDNPGVLGPNEAKTVEGGQVAVDLPLQPQAGPDLSAQTHPVLKHHRPRYTHTKKDDELHLNEEDLSLGDQLSNNSECDTLEMRETHFLGSDFYQGNSSTYCR